jgi:hypothetical protein
MSGVNHGLGLAGLSQTVLIAMRHTSAHVAQGRQAEIDRVRHLASRGSRPIVQSLTSAVTIHVTYASQTSVVRLGTQASESSVRAAIAAALNIPNADPFELLDSTGAFTAVSASSLRDGTHYTARLRQRTERAHVDVADGAQEPSAVSQEVEGLRAQLVRVTTEKNRLQSACQQSIEAKVTADGVTLSGKPAMLPRVVLASLGTGRYRSISLAALASAKEHFGGDSEVSLHLLSDDISGVDAVYNPVIAPWVLLAVGALDSQ